MKTYEYVNFGLLGGAANILGKVGGFFGNMGQGIGTGVSNAANATGNFFKNMGQGIATGVGNAVNAVKNDWNSMGSQLQSGYNDVRNGGTAEQAPAAQPAVAEDNTVVKNPNTPNWEELDTNTALGDVTQGGMSNAQTQQDLTKGVQQIEAQKAEAARKAKADAEAKKKAEAEKQAQLQAQQEQQAKQNQSNRVAQGQQRQLIMSSLAKLQRNQQLAPNEIAGLKALKVNVQADTQSIIKQLQSMALQLA